MEIALFDHIASKIETSETKEDVLKLFKVLAGEEDVKNSIPFLTEATLKSFARNFDNSPWTKAKKLEGLVDQGEAST